MKWFMLAAMLVTVGALFPRNAKANTCDQLVNFTQTCTSGTSCNRTITVQACQSTFGSGINCNPFGQLIPCCNTLQGSATNQGDCRNPRTIGSAAPASGNSSVLLVPMASGGFVPRSIAVTSCSSGG